MKQMADLGPCNAISTDLNVISSFAVLGGPKLFIAGGFSGGNIVTSQVVNLDGDGRICSAPKDLPFAWREMASLVTDDGSPLVCGGNDASNAKVKDCYRYVVGDNDWVKEDNVALANPKSGLGSIEVSPNKFWVFGGDAPDSEVYYNGNFIDGPDLPADRFNDPCMVKIDDTRTFIASTFDQNGYIYDWSTNDFTDYPGLLPLKPYGAACGLAKKANGDKLIVIPGGIFAGTSVMVIDVATMTPRQPPAANLPYNFQFATPIPFGDTFLVVGGGFTAPNNRRIWEFDPENEVFFPRPEELSVPTLYSYAAMVGEDQVTCN